MSTIQKIYEQANAIGQCGLFTGAEMIEDLVVLFRSPQGQEFCLKHDFPSLKTWREIAKEHDLTRFGIYVDAGRLSLSNAPHVTLVGATSGELRHNELKRHNVVLMHGAHANITAEQWAVVFVHAAPSSTYIGEQRDSAKIL